MGHSEIYCRDAREHLTEPIAVVDPKDLLKAAESCLRMHGHTWVADAIQDLVDDGGDLADHMGL
jgi:hypothetical protein